MSSFIYQTRFKKVIKAMQEDSCLVLFSPPPRLRNQSIYYPYRTSSDLLYLTGISQENIIFVLCSTGEKHIFVEKHNPQKERWEGRRFTGKYIAEHLQFSDNDDHHEYKDFWKTLPRLIENKNTLYWSYLNEPETHQKIIHLLNQMQENLRGGSFGPTNLKHSACLLNEIRLFKDSTEIQLMKKAADISTKAHTNLMRYSREQTLSGNPVYEYDLRAFLEANLMKEEGVTGLAYSSIVAGGENATVLHYIQCNQLVKNRDLLLVDAGCEYRGYASDITRTYPLSGRFSEAQKDIYEIVLQAQKEAIAECKPGSDLKKIHEKAVRALSQGLWDMGLFKKCIKKEENGKLTFVKPASLDEVVEKNYYFSFYMHYTSHYLGLDVHDVGSYYNQKKKHRKLEAGMVFTVEPGLYFSKSYQHIPKAYRGMGIRIEDDILITKKGKEILTNAVPKEIEEIESL